MSSSLLGALAEVLLVNLVLSGDNAVVIGLAARGLELNARRRAILLGGGLAVVLRLALTIPAEYLLTVPYLRAAGGLLLAWVAYRLITTDSEETERGSSDSIATAVKLIIVADLTMSLDNILAVAAVAERSEHDVVVLVFGLALSIPIVLLGGGLVARLMHRLPILVWAGAAILGYTAGELIAEDDALEELLHHVPHSRIGLPFVVMAIVLFASWLRVRANREPKVNAVRVRYDADSRPGNA